MEIETFTKSQNSSATINALVVKRNLNQVDQIVCLIFSYGNSGFSIKILTDEIQHRCSLLFKLNRIRFLPFSLRMSLLL